MGIRQKFKDISNNCKRFAHYVNRLGVSDDVPHDINEILALQKQKWSDIGDSNLNTEYYDLHNRDIRTLEEYFINHGKGFDNPDIIQDIDNRNFEVKIYSRNLRLNKLEKVKQQIIRTFQDMAKLGIGDNAYNTQTIKLYIFNNHNDYKHYGQKLGLGLGDEGGKHYYIGQDGILSKIYVYQDGDVHNLVHEIVHANIAHITLGMTIPKVLSEGIADNIQHNLSQDAHVRGKSIDVTQKQLIEGYDLSKILNLDYSDGAQHALVYRVGHALTMYFDWLNPQILRHYLSAVRYSQDIKYANRILYQNYDSEQFKTFLVEHSTETEMKSINALKVERGDKLATVKELIDKQYQDVTYYEANIILMARAEIVGKFSSVLHYALGNTMRVTSADLQSYFNLSKDFHFMKIVRHIEEGKLKLIHCDRYGNAYQDSDEYQQQLDSIKSHYSSYIDYQNVIEKLTYFDLNSVRNIKDKDFLDYFSEAHIFSLKALSANPAKMLSGISIYLDNVKIGELVGDTTYVKEVGDNGIITHYDSLINMYTTSTEAYVAVKQDNKKYKMFFIEGRKVEADRYFDVPHIHINPLFEPSINNINFLNEELLIRNTDVLDHIDSKIAKYSENYKASKHTIQKGRLLDDKGTEREIDDVYEAETVYLGNTIDVFRNIGFAISEFGDLFIYDHGKGLSYQLPNTISHLKLVKLVSDGGTVINRLIPVTQDGNEFPAGMPNIPDKYRFIDPIFAHKYEKEDHSHQHVTIGLVNFDKYAVNSLFKIKYDPNDYHIIKDKYGNILRRGGSTTYITQVKLYDENGIEELGMLSNDFHQFKGKIFISFDYNYSYKDFLMSYASKFEYKTLSDGTKVLMFEQSESDISNNNYQDYKRVVISSNTKFPSQSDMITTEENQYRTNNLVQNNINDLVSLDTFNIKPTSINYQIPTAQEHNNNVGIMENVISASNICTIIAIFSAVGGVLYSGYHLYQYLIDKNNHGHGNRNNSNTNENIELQSLVPVEITSTPAEAIRLHIQQQNNQNGFYNNNTDDIYENNIESDNCSTNTEWSHSRIETENNTGNMNINNTYLHDTEVIGDITL